MPPYGITRPHELSIRTDFKYHLPFTIQASTRRWRINSGAVQRNQKPNIHVCVWMHLFCNRKWIKNTLFSTDTLIFLLVCCAHTNTCYWHWQHFKHTEAAHQFKVFNSFCTDFFFKTKEFQNFTCSFLFKSLCYSIYIYQWNRHMIFTCLKENVTPMLTCHRADSRLAPSQWETSLQSNGVSDWLDANLESALSYYHICWWLGGPFNTP